MPLFGVWGEFGDHQVRVILKDGDAIWFVAGDVASALLDPDEKGVHILDTLGGAKNRTHLVSDYPRITNNPVPSARGGG